MASNLTGFLLKSQNREGYNFISLKNGKYSISNEEWDEFVDSYFDFKHSPTKHTSLVFRWPKRTKNPVCIDLDFRLLTHEGFSFNKFVNQSVVDFTRHILKVVGEGKAYIIAKEDGYYKAVKGVNYFCVGAHLYLPSLWLTKSESSALRNQVLDTIKMHFKFNFQNSNEDVIDSRVFPNRTNGLVLVGDYKNVSSGGQYLPRLCISFENGNYEIEKCNLTKELFNILYKSLLFSSDFQIKENKIVMEVNRGVPETRVEKPKEEIVLQSSPKECGEFDLRAFLECTSNHTPSHDEWLSIIAFSKSVGLKKKFTCDLCNQFWKPSNNRESYTLWNNLTKKCSFSKGTIIWYLREYANDEFDESLIFPKRVFQYYSEAHQFMVARNRTWDLATIEDFCDSVFGFVAKQKKYVYKDRVVKSDKFGNEFNEISTVYVDKRPYSGEDAILITLSRSFEEVKKYVKKRCPKQTSRNLKDVELYLATQKILTGEETDMCKKASLEKLYDLEPSEISLGKVLKSRNSKGFVMRYGSMTYCPYLKIDPTPADVYNTFTGFPLIDYTPTQEFNVKDTMIWKWLFEVYANCDQKKFEYILDSHTSKLLHPEVRSERLWVLLSSEHGVGKTSYFHWWRSLTSSEHVLFYHDYKTFADGFNMLQANKLLVYIDDISGISKSESQSFNSRITLVSMKFNEKNEKPFVLDVCDEIVVSTNENNILYSTNEDRRQLYIRCSGKYKQDKNFFKPLYAEFNNKNVMKAWFDFLISRKCNPDFNFQDDPFKEETQRQKNYNMKATWQFMLDFFSRENWPILFKPHFIMPMAWGRAYEFKIIKKKIDDPALMKGDSVLLICADRLYELYLSFMGKFNSGCRKVKVTTFFEQLEPLGIKKYRKRKLKDKSRTICYIKAGNVRSFIAQKFPGMNIPEFMTDRPEDVLHLKELLSDFENEE